ncbi:hypothetical protein [Oscillatoria sp. HE19RPO]|nr:hypothetical protein [Oscillatoria sp. HE19RPO]
MSYWRTEALSTLLAMAAISHDLGWQRTYPPQEQYLDLARG